MKIVWEISLDEANAVLQLLGNVPTANGAYPLYARLKQETENQVNNPDQPMQ